VESDGRLGDFVRRAVSAGFEAATKSKDDVLRVATTEIRGWLDHLDLDRELMKALARMTVEVKAEIRFKPNAEGQLKPEATTSVAMRGKSTDASAAPADSKPTRVPRGDASATASTSQAKSPESS